MISFHVSLYKISLYKSLCLYRYSFENYSTHTKSQCSTVEFKAPKDKKSTNTVFETSLFIYLSFFFVDFSSEKLRIRSIMATACSQSQLSCFSSINRKLRFQRRFVLLPGFRSSKVPLYSP